MKYTLTVVLVCIAAFSAMSQNDSGIFLSTKCATKSQRQTVLITGKQICLASNPIILATEFTSISDVKQQGDKSSFDLTMSPKAVQVLMQISSSLPRSTFALVVDKEVFYVFPASDLTVNRTFRFQATGKDANVFNGIQKKLKALIDTRTE